MILSDLENLVKREKSIVGFKIIVNPEKFVKHLIQFFTGATIEKTRLTYIRYKPGIECSAKFKLKLNGKKKIISARAWNLELYEKFCKNHNHSEVINKNKILVEKSKLLISVFPYDNQIKSLKHFHSLKNQNKLFQKVFPDSPELWLGKLKTLSYKPERRYVGGVSTSGGLNGIVKFYVSRRYSQAKKTSDIFKSKKNLVIPKCFCKWDHHKIISYEWLQGKVLANILREDGDSTLKAMRNTGRALGEFHSQKVIGLKILRIKNEKLEKMALANYLGFLCPPLSEKARKIAKFFKLNLVPQMVLNYPIHRDFNTNNVIISREKVGFIDFDEALLGDPRIDLGSFIASLEYLSLNGKLSKKSLESLKSEFLLGYNDIISNALLKDLDLFVAYELFQYSIAPFRNFKHNWPAKSNKILNLVKTIIKNNSTNNENQVLSPIEGVKLE